MAGSLKHPIGMTPKDWETYQTKSRGIPHRYGTPFTSAPQPVDAEEVQVKRFKSHNEHFEAAPSPCTYKKAVPRCKEVLGEKLQDGGTLISKILRADDRGELLSVLGS
jgi:hypothetical protein